MLKKALYPLMAMSVAFGVLATSYQPAEARRGGGVALGVGAAILGLGLLGAHAHAREHRYYHRGSCYKGPEECSWKNRRCFENRYGDVVCRGGHYSCWRPTICD
jgi:hypothetical protein